MATFFSDATLADLAIGETLKRALGRAVGVVRGAPARRWVRQDYCELLERDDHVLADIGMSREEVRRALGGCGGR